VLYLISLLEPMGDASLTPLCCVRWVGLCVGWWCIVVDSVEWFPCGGRGKSWWVL